MTHGERLGLAGGAAIGGVLLIAAAALLLSVPETSAKVLVAVWLWALPVLGLTSVIGWLAARLISRGRGS